jgi:hypothetical protein
MYLPFSNMLQVDSYFFPMFHKFPNGFWSHLLAYLTRHRLQIHNFILRVTLTFNMTSFNTFSLVKQGFQMNV